MNKIEQNLKNELDQSDDIVFAKSDDELFKRAVTTANVQQGSKDLIALGMASIWVVFASIFIKILQPIFKNMADNNRIK